MGLWIAMERKDSVLQAETGTLERVGPFGTGAGESMDHREGGEGMGGGFPIVCRDNGGFLPVSGFARNIE
jgi:hypothetical protein